MIENPSLYLFIVIGYFFGSIPTGYLVSKTKGVDIFKTGNCNPGTANIYSNLGRFYGYTVFTFDFLKGALPVILVQYIGSPTIILILVALSTMNGHWFPIFLKFKGGIGLATAIGAIFGLAVIPFLISSLPAVLALYFFKKTHYSGLAFFVSISTFAIIMQVNPYLICTTILIGLLVGVNHWFRIKNKKDTNRTKTPYAI